MKYLKVTEAAKELGFSRQTILAWINAGKLKAVKGIKEYRIPEEEIERIKSGKNV